MCAFHGVLLVGAFTLTPSITDTTHQGAAMFRQPCPAPLQPPGGPGVPIPLMSVFLPQSLRHPWRPFLHHLRAMGNVAGQIEPTFFPGLSYHCLFTCCCHDILYWATVFRNIWTRSRYQSLLKYIPHLRGRALSIVLVSPFLGKGC